MTQFKQFHSWNQQNVHNEQCILVNYDEKVQKTREKCIPKRIREWKSEKRSYLFKIERHFIPIQMKQEKWFEEQRNVHIHCACTIFFAASDEFLLWWVESGRLTKCQIDNDVHFVPTDECQI